MALTRQRGCGHPCGAILNMRADASSERDHSGRCSDQHVTAFLVLRSDFGETCHE